MAEDPTGDNPCAQLLDGTLPPVELPIVTGWRRFGYLPTGQFQPLRRGDKQGVFPTGILAGMYAEPWPGRDKHAECLCNEYWHMRQEDWIPGDHLAHPQGRCGIYVLKAMEDMSPIPAYQAIPVAAQVVAWGKGFEHETGYRMENVRIERIWIRSFPGDPSTAYSPQRYSDARIDEIAVWLKDHYGVPTERGWPTE